MAFGTGVRPLDCIRKGVAEAWGVVEQGEDTGAVFSDAASPASGTHFGLVLPFEQVDEDDDGVVFYRASIAACHVVEFFEEVVPIDVVVVAIAQSLEGRFEPAGAISFV